MAQYSQILEDGHVVYARAGEPVTRGVPASGRQVGCERIDDADSA